MSEFSFISERVNVLVDLSLSGSSSSFSVRTRHRTYERNTKTVKMNLEYVRTMRLDGFVALDTDHGLY